MYQNYMDDLSQFFLVLGQFVTLYILDDLSQVIFVTILFWTICHKSYLSYRRCLKKRTVIWGDT